MRRLVTSLSAFALVLLVTGVIGTPSASAQQSINLFVGGFVPRSLDARTNDDVLFNNLNFLIFDIHDFTGPTVGGEWLVGLGNNIEAGLGVGFYTRTSPAIYRGYTNKDRSEIEQDLKLRTIPFTATVRFLPLGRHAAVQPYIGAGVGVTRFRYSESGQFVDFSDKSIFRDNFIGSGTATGPVVLGGVRIPVGSFDVGGEIRYQLATGELPASESFTGSKIDLGGMNYLFTVNIRF
jgi:outer membrane protein W